MTDDATEIYRIGGSITASYLYIKTLNKGSDEFKEAVKQHQALEQNLHDASREYWLRQGVDING
jgi:hypothetical protein